MGLIRKTVKLSTLGLAPIHYRDKEERQIKAAERQLKVQRQMLKEQRAAAHTPTVIAAARVPPDRVAQLERLAELRNQGVLTDEEFDAQKLQILNG